MNGRLQARRLSVDRTAYATGHSPTPTRVRIVQTASRHLAPRRRPVKLKETRKRFEKQILILLREPRVLGEEGRNEAVSPIECIRHGMFSPHLAAWPPFHRPPQWTPDLVSPALVNAARVMVCSILRILDWDCEKPIWTGPRTCPQFHSLAAFLPPLFACPGVVLFGFSRCHHCAECSNVKEILAHPGSCLFIRTIMRFHPQCLVRSLLFPC